MMDYAELRAEFYMSWCSDPQKLVTKVPALILTPVLAGEPTNVPRIRWVPFWGLTYVFGRSDMYWYRLVEHVGRFDVVGTTVKSADKLPEHLLADEKFTSIAGQERFVALTVGSDVVLGAALALTAQVDELETAYGDFKREALRLNPRYTPQTLNLDGCKQARLVWSRLFPTVVIILCFLHAVFRVRQRCLSHPLYGQIQALMWRIYHAKSQTSYYYHFDQFLTFARQHLKGEAICGQSNTLPSSIRCC
jgi:hypothetical protein